MMLSDLVDEIDIFEDFKALGSPVVSSDSPLECCKKTIAWLDDQDSETIENVNRLIRGWSNNRNLLLPHVSKSLEVFPEFK